VKYAIQMGSGAMITQAKFNKDWFRNSKVVKEGGGGDTCTDTDSKEISSACFYCIFFFQNKESRPTK
jgi:hypothetical protein